MVANAKQAVANSDFGLCLLEEILAKEDHQAAVSDDAKGDANGQGAADALSRHSMQVGNTPLPNLKHT